MVLPKPHHIALQAQHKMTIDVKVWRKVQAAPARQQQGSTKKVDGYAWGHCKVLANRRGRTQCKSQGLKVPLHDANCTRNLSSQGIIG